jgi:hypothetical protein
MSRAIAVALSALLLAVALFAPTDWLSEGVWAALLVACIVWELYGVFTEKRSRQEPLTHIYRDKLMSLDKWGWIFRSAFVALFVWWLLHWFKRLGA